MSGEQPAPDRLLTRFPPAVIDSEREGGTGCPPDLRAVGESWAPQLSALLTPISCGMLLQCNALIACHSEKQWGRGVFQRVPVNMNGAKVRMCVLVLPLCLFFCGRWVFVYMRVAGLYCKRGCEMCAHVVWDSSECMATSLCVFELKCACICRWFVGTWRRSQIILKFPFSMGLRPDICSLFASPYSEISFPTCLGLIPLELVL